MNTIETVKAALNAQKIPFTVIEENGKGSDALDIPNIHFDVAISSRFGNKVERVTYTKNDILYMICVHETTVQKNANEQGRAIAKCLMGRAGKAKRVA